MTTTVVVVVAVAAAVVFVITGMWGHCGRTSIEVRACSSRVKERAISNEYEKKKFKLTTNPPDCSFSGPYMNSCGECYFQ